MAGQQPLEHALGQLRFGGEIHVVADPGLGAAWPIVGPGLRQVQLPVDQRPPARGHVGQEHPELTVLDPARRPGVLPLHTGRAGALLEETGLVGHHHPGRVAEPVQHVAAQVIAHRVGVPGVEVQQPLHAVRAQVTGLLGDRPGVLALRPRQQPQQVQPGSAAGLNLREPARDQAEHVIEPGLPPREGIIIYRRRRGHRVIFKIQHTLKLITRWPSP